MPAIIAPKIASVVVADRVTGWAPSSKAVRPASKGATTKNTSPSTISQTIDMPILATRSFVPLKLDGREAENFLE